MSDPLCEATGHDGSVRLYRDRVVMTHKRLGSSIMGGDEREIPLDNVATVNFRTPKTIRSGFIEIIPSGYEDPAGSWGGQNWNYRIQYRTGVSDFKELRQRLQELREERMYSDGNEGASEGNDDPLEILKQRYARGEIDDEEFERKRAMLED